MLRWLIGALLEIVEAIVDAITGGGARAKTMEGLEARRRAEDEGERARAKGSVGGV